MGVGWVVGEADVAVVVLKLFAISLGMEEDWFVNRHRYERFDESWFRYMMFFHEHDAEVSTATASSSSEHLAKRCQNVD